jgi:hypothetical protein
MKFSAHLTPGSIQNGPLPDNALRGPEQSPVHAGVQDVPAIGPRVSQHLEQSGRATPVHPVLAEGLLRVSAVRLSEGAMSPRLSDFTFLLSTDKHVRTQALKLLDSDSICTPEQRQALALCLLDAKISIVSHDRLAREVIELLKAAGALWKIPPRAITFTDEDVIGVLSKMDVDFGWPGNGLVKKLTETLSCVRTGAGNWVLEGADDRFYLGVKLLEPSREVLKLDVARTSGVDVSLCNLDRHEIVKFVSACRRPDTVPQAEVRRALYVGGSRSTPDLEENHASLVVYVKKEGREAVLFVDSTRGVGRYSHLKGALEEFRAMRIPVYVMQGHLQRGPDACSAFTWEAMEILCGRQGLQGAWRIPDLFAELDEHLANDPESANNDGVKYVNPPPEILRMAQMERTIFELGDDRLYDRLRHSDKARTKARTLGQVTHKHSYKVEGVRFPMMDKLRIVGDRWRIRAEISAINEHMYGVAEGQSEGWSPEAGDEFKRRMLLLARESRKPAFAQAGKTWQNFAALEELTKRPYEFAQAALIALEQIKGMMVPPPSAEHWSGLSDEALTALCENYFIAEELWSQVADLTDIWEFHLRHHTNLDITTLIAKLNAAFKSLSGHSKIHSEAIAREQSLRVALRQGSQVEHGPDAFAQVKASSADQNVEEDGPS